MARPRSRRAVASVRVASLLAASLLFSAVNVGPQQVATASSHPSLVGSWSTPVDVGVVGVHAILLHTGEVLLFNKPTGTRGTVAKVWDPSDGSVMDVTMTSQHNVFCAGHSFLSNGDVLVTGGTSWGQTGANGTRQTSVFDPISQRWRDGPQMTYPRWYPTNVALPDGDTLIFSGKTTKSDWVDEIELHDHVSDTISPLPRDTSLRIRFYPRMFLARDGRIVRAGQERRTKFFDPDTQRWTSGPAMKFGSRIEGTSVLLPGLQRILSLGGTSAGVTTATAEILDVAVTEPAWRYTTSMVAARRNVDAVLLPDGTVLVVGGNGSGNFTSPVLAAELFDPVTESWTTLAAQEAPRGYHSTALLLPDGRVLSAGQTNGIFQRTIEVFSPPYLSSGARPRITSAPSVVGYGETLTVESPDADAITDVVLMRPGSVTHSVNFEQRHVALSFTHSGGALTIGSPNTADQAPPGWYMLFLVVDGIPSEAAWVRVA